jgi:hypothetical protein
MGILEGDITTVFGLSVTLPSSPLTKVSGIVYQHLLDKMANL